MIVRRLITVLCLIFIGYGVGARDFNDPAAWLANSSGQMAVSFDSTEKALKVTAKFKPGSDYWVYPKFEFQEIPENVKKVAFETRSVQSDNNAGYRTGYVMFAGSANVRYQPGTEWQTVTIDLDASKIDRKKTQGIQIGLNPKSEEVTYYIRNLQFLNAEGSSVALPVKESRMAQVQKNFSAAEKWASPDIPVISEPTGFFHIARKNDIWWFADPEGKPFYSIGLNYCMGAQFEWRQQPPQFEKAFFKVEDECRKLSLKFKEWEFNTCGTVGGNWNGRFPVTPIFRIIQQANEQSAKGLIPRSEKHKFIDVHSKEFEDFCDVWAQRVVKPEADNPLILGWFIDNEFHLPQDEAFQIKFYETVVAAIRRYDKNHLLLGTRFEAPNRSDLDIRMVAKYNDVVTVNYYDYPHDRKAFDRIYKIGGKPLLIGEFTAAAKENGVTNSKYWRGGLFENQYDRAKGYERYASEMAELPYMLGTHYFMLDNRNEPKLNNWGLRDSDGKLYYDFVRHLGEINKRLPLIHEGKLKPRKFPELKCAVNDNPHIRDAAHISKDGKWLWQMTSLYYTCTPGSDIYYFERTHDENWGCRENGFLEYRFTLEKPLKNAHFIIRYAAGADNTLKLEINDHFVTAIQCPKPDKNLVVPPGWAYGFSQMKLSMVSIPLNSDIPAGYTNVRFIVDQPWKKGRGMKIQGFFLSEGPHKVSEENYYALEKQ